MWAARVVCWGFALGADRGFAILWEHFNPRCVPEWSEPELRRKCDQAVAGDFRHSRGWLLDADPDRPARNPDPRPIAPPRAAGGPESPSPAPLPSDPGERPAGQGGGAPPAAEPVAGVEDDDPFRLARLYLERYRHPDGLTLRYWAQDFARWDAGAYDRLAENAVRNELTECVEAEFCRLHALRVERFAANAERGGPADKKLPRKQRVTRGVVGDVMQAMRALCALPVGLAPPCWTDEGPPPAELLSTRSGIVHLPSLADRRPSVCPPTPRFVTPNRVGFDFDPDAPQPREWLAFLARLWPHDPDSVACLQEWFGYLLTPDTSLQRMLLMIGPPRSGKGTIARVLKQLIGERNVAAPTLGQLADRFGVQDLLDKTLALIGDARLSGRADAVAVTEQLLGISGEDPRTIDRKHREPITTKLNTRFVLLSNELPRFGDASGAIITRLCVLRLTRSFAGEEDTGLLDRLLPELPGILMWAVEGWARLQVTRRFTSPESAAELIEDAEALASPVRLFVAERCQLDPDAATPTRELYDEWRRWCETHGRDTPGTQEMFVRDMRAALPSITSIRPRAGERRVPSYQGIRVLSAVETGDLPL